MKNWIEVHKPAIKRKDLEYVLNCMINDKIDYGEFAKNFENRLAERTGAFNVLAVNSFYNCLQLIIDALELKEGDEVLVPSFAPQVYLNVIVKNRLKPVLIDMEDGYFQPSLEKVREAVTEKTKLFFLIYYFGYTFDPGPYVELVPHLVEDISSVIGATMGEGKAGTFGRYAVCDFSAKSIITTGDGGAVFSTSRKTHSKLLSFIEKDYGIDDYYPRYPVLMPDLNAAMGVSQDESLNHRLKLRETIGHIYEEAVKKSRNSIIPSKDQTDRLYSDFPIFIKSNVKEIIAYLKKNGVEAVRPYPFCLHHYLNLPKENFQNTENFYLNTLLVPLYSGLMKKDVELVAKLIATML